MFYRHRLLAVLALIVSPCGACWAQEFSADLKCITNGSASMGKVYVKNNYVRIDNNYKGHNIFTILAENGNSTAWVYDKDLKLYWSFTREDPFNFLNKISECQDWKGIDMGFEKVSGLKCHKIAYPVNGGKETRWYSEKLKVPIKFERELINHRTTLLYMNIKVGKQKDEIFMIPGNYENRVADYWTKIMPMFDK
jgi:hypothetical protein